MVKRLLAFACITPVALLVVVMAEEPVQSVTPTVRVIYAIPSDREVTPGAPEALAAAVTDVQQWYAEQMGGPTFELVGEMPRICHMPHASDHFDDVDWYLRTLRAIEGRCAPRQPTERHILVIYADVPPVCEYHNGAALGWDGFAMLNRVYLMGLVDPEQEDICADFREPIPEGYRSGFRDTVEEWHGALAHELGHALGLSHHEACQDRANCLDDSVIGMGAYSYPDTYLHELDRSLLLRSWQAGSVPNGNMQW